MSNENLVNPVKNPVNPVKRLSGILVHPTSFPGPYGIGDLGPEAYRFIDFLVASGQSLWQVLPLGPTGYGDSPYACYSAFAGNTLLVSPEQLIKEGLLDSAPYSFTSRQDRFWRSTQPQRSNSAPRVRTLHENHRHFSPQRFRNVRPAPRTLARRLRTLPRPQRRARRRRVERVGTRACAPHTVSTRARA